MIDRSLMIFLKTMKIIKIEKFLFLTFLIEFVIVLLILINFIDQNHNFSEKLKLSRFEHDQMLEKEPDILELAEQNSNVAIKYWTEWINYRNNDNEWLEFDVDVCKTKLPGLNSIRFNNINFQTIEESGHYFYNAYYDNRSDQKLVRVIFSMFKDFDKQLKCLLYFTDKRTPIRVKSSKIIHKNIDSLYTIAILNCEIPETIGDMIPRSVSITFDNNCTEEVENNLRVIYNKPENERKGIAVCHKAFRFEQRDWSLRLIEWLESIKMFGAEKVYLYSYSVHPNMKQVLDYYTNIGFIELRWTTLPGDQLNNNYFYEYYSTNEKQIFYVQERLEINDCIYRNMYRYKYITLFDIDEMLLPTYKDNWIDMLQEINDNIGESLASQLQSYHFFKYRSFNEKFKEDTNQLNYTLKHLKRSAQPNARGKSIHLAENIVFVNNHYNNDCRDVNRCKVYYDHHDQMGYFLHYRSTNKLCNGKGCVFDDKISRFERVLNKLTQNAYSQIFN